jgi:hypothetical protein
MRTIWPLCLMPGQKSLSTNLWTRPYGQKTHFVPIEHLACSPNALRIHRLSVTPSTLRAHGAPARASAPGLIRVHRDSSRITSALRSHWLSKLRLPAASAGCSQPATAAHLRIAGTGLNRVHGLSGVQRAPRSSPVTHSRDVGPARPTGSPGPPDSSESTGFFGTHGALRNSTWDSNVVVPTREASASERLHQDPACSTSYCLQPAELSHVVWRHGGQPCCRPQDLVVSLTVANFRNSRVRPD